jgi:hypothetical protein
MKLPVNDGREQAITRLPIIAMLRLLKNFGYFSFVIKTKMELIPMANNMEKLKIVGTMNFVKGARNI